MLADKLLSSLQMLSVKTGRNLFVLGDGDLVSACELFPLLHCVDCAAESLDGLSVIETKPARGTHECVY